MNSYQSVEKIVEHTGYAINKDGVGKEIWREGNNTPKGRNRV